MLWGSMSDRDVSTDTECRILTGLLQHGQVPHAGCDLAHMTAPALNELCGPTPGLTALAMTQFNSCGEHRSAVDVITCVTMPPTHPKR